MKKYLILAVTAAIVAVGCTKTFEVTPTPTDSNPIGFGTWANVLTKARATASDDTAFGNGDVFDVYGYKTVGSTNNVVFTGDDVTATVSGSTVTWDYAPHRFWDPAASSYTFFAVLPANQLAAEGANPYATTGLFTSNDITFDDPTAFNNDILVADKTVAAGSGSAAPYSYAAYATSPYVQINFNHVASCVDLLVKQDNTLGNATVTITALSLLNISNKGHFAVSAYAGSSPYAPTVEWTTATSSPTVLETTASTGEYVILDSTDNTDDVTVTGKTTYSSHSASSTTDDAAELFSGYVFMPQAIVAATQQIKLSYTIQVGSEEPNVYNDVVIDIRDFMTTDTDNNSGTQITAWAPKTKYIYTMTIGANYIQFSASVKEWATTTNGYQYLIN